MISPLAALRCHRNLPALSLLISNLPAAIAVSLFVSRPAATLPLAGSVETAAEQAISPGGPITPLPCRRCEHQRVGRERKDYLGAARYGTSGSSTVFGCGGSRYESCYPGLSCRRA